MPSQSPYARRRFTLPAMIIACCLTGAGVYYFTSKLPTNSATSSGQQSQSSNTDPEATAPTSHTVSYSQHTAITATVFWVGEDATEENKFIQNRSSAWLEDWQGSYGGVDDPDNRCGNYPCGFTPKENPFYFALPYNDFDEAGKRKASAQQLPWYSSSLAAQSSSWVKNRWIKVSHGTKTVYVQWEDVGPYGEDDFGYVFGSQHYSAPEAGLDLSPAAAGYLGIDGSGTTSWQFVDDKDVPVGPWKDIVTTR